MFITFDPFIQYSETRYHWNPWAKCCPIISKLGTDDLQAMLEKNHRMDFSN
jgi:hypothetical protein